MKLTVGNEPQKCGLFKLTASEMMFILYLPVIMPNSNLRLPENLKWTEELFSNIDYTKDDYVYLSVKSMYVGLEGRGRPGWHLDGFSTDDINYVWSDSYPTEFCIQNIEVSNDCKLSLQELEEQVLPWNVVKYPNNTLLRLDKTVIHRVSPSPDYGMRTFVKISVSKNKYNLLGNAHNYLFNYNWNMLDRDISRNHPSVNVS